MELSALRPDFGVEVRGIGLIDVASSDSVYRATRAALEEHSVLLFRDQDVTGDVQAAFPRAFGPLEQVKIGSVGAYIQVGNSVSNGWQPSAFGLVIKTDAHQRHRLGDAKALRETPPHQLSVRWIDRDWTDAAYGIALV